MPDPSPNEEQPRKPESSPAPPAQPEITRWLHEWQQGDSEAGEKLFDATYDELRQMAQRLLYSARQRHAMQTGTLVHEMFMRLAGNQQLQAKCRATFFAYAATTMRRLIIDSVRWQRCDIRGGGAEHLPPSEQLLDLNGLSEEHCFAWMAFEDAFQALLSIAPDQAQVIMLRHYLGLTIEEAAVASDVSVATVKRRELYARAWLRRQMHNAAGGHNEQDTH